PCSPGRQKSQPIRAHAGPPWWWTTTRTPPSPPPGCCVRSRTTVPSSCCTATRTPASKGSAAARRRSSAWPRPARASAASRPPATARLLRARAADGAQLLLHGDPDAGVQGFRGGTPALVGLAETREGLGGFAAHRIELRTAHRHPPDLRAATMAITAAIATTG